MIKSDRKFANLEEYCNDFINFIQTDKRLFLHLDEENHILSKIDWFFGVIRQETLESIGTYINSHGLITDREGNKITRRVIEKHFKRSHESEFIPGFDQQFIDGFIKKYERQILEKIKEVFQDVQLTQKNREKLKLIAANLFSRICYLNEFSGVVIAGFGIDELYPSFYSYIIEGVIENKLMYDFSAETP